MSDELQFVVGFSQRLVPVTARQTEVCRTFCVSPKGLQQGAEQGERKLTLRLLERRIGKLSRPVQQKVERLTVEQIETLGEALLEFQSKDDLTRWLKQHA